ncbi:MAG: MFS transporter [Candidatus Paralactobacillus gallistercoris]|uniref:MFS transporter n=1 Tax=Candidatus Paralactobacillus gallistercoris TaxID=2838724 RepID=A0A948TJ86_9LACO|nr:MFS transporter [Candidatus Paralactobacillus gallistercoris]
MGYNLVMPFMSLYIRQLGNFNAAQLNFWSGFSFSITFLVSAIMAPMWGKLADRHGRKLILMCTSFGMATMLGLMGTVQNVYELLLLRLGQGFFAGYVSNTTALIATSAPQEHSGKAISTLSTGTTSGMLIGPLLGGIIAQAVGYRHTFFITSATDYIVFLLTTFLVHEEYFQPVTTLHMNAKKVFKQLRYPQVIIGMMVTTMIIQASNNSISPIISLYIRQLLHGHGKVALISGIIAALPGIANLCVASRFGALGDKIGTQKILIAGLLLALCVYIPQAFVHNVWQLAGLRLLVGISDAALIPQVQTLLSKYAPHEFSGRIFSYNQSFQFMGNVIGPMIGSFVSNIGGYSSVFLSTTFLIVINLIWVTINTRQIRNNH